MKVAIEQIGWFCFCAAVVVLAAAPGRAETLSRPVYCAGHCDLRAGYTADDGTMTLNYHFDPSVTAEDGTSLSGKYASTDLYTRVPDSARTTVSSQSYADFMGASVGDDVWILPQSQSSGTNKPYLGFSTEEFSSSNWSTNITYTLLGVSGPGQFSMYGITGVNTLSVYWSSYDEEETKNGDNTYTISANAHKHANWSFTAEGVYDVQMQIKGTLKSGAEALSDVKTFTFLVGGSTVPEPGTITLLSSAALGVLFGLWKRSRKKGGQGKQSL